jgi:pyruvate dehydrogenase E2 component (dihydrolipoamide acetyltransferase)
MPEIKMPSLGADMDAGTLVEWHVQPGSPVKRGDIVALVETQKGIVEIETWEAGTVSRLLVRPGDKVPVGTILATLEEGAAPATRIMASPAARQLAREKGIDLAGVHGTGPHGSITRDDVVATQSVPAAKTTPAPAPKIEKTEPPGMRDAIAAAMARSKREIPHYYLAEDVDVTQALAWLASTNATRAPADRLLLAALLVKATARAAREVPEMNGWFKDGAFVPGAGVHVGVAISLRRGGLVAPAILDADKKSSVEIMHALRDLANRVRSGTLRSSELSEPTITVTNLGEQGVGSVFGVIYPPQVAIVGFGRVVERPWARDGMIGVRSIVSATVSADHRVSDGHRGARFLATIARLLAEPEKP